MSRTNLRLDLLQAALVREIRDVMPAETPVALAGAVPAFPSDPEIPLVKIELISGPSFVHRGRAQARSLMLPDTVTLTIDTATSGERYFSRVNGVSYWTDGVAGDTVTTIRDRLANDMQDGVDGTEPYVAATESGSDQLVLAPDEPGGLWDVKISGPLSGAVGSLTAYKVTESTRRATLNIQVFSRDVSFRNGASQLLANIVSMLERPSVAERFSDYGIAIWQRGAVTPLNILVGDTSWESRSSVDVDFALRSVYAEPTDTIGVVDVALEGRFEVGGSPVHQDTFTIQE